MSLRPAFVVGGLYSEANGVARIMRDLASALGRAGSPVTVYGAECRGRTSIGHIFKPPTHWVGSPGLWLGGLSWSPKLKAQLNERLREADVIHNHSVWMLPNHYSSRAARDANRPVMITAHGTLEPWALRNSRWKKRAAGLLFQDRDLKRADCIHVNSERELAGVRAYGLTQPVAVIPNGVDLCEFEGLPSPEVFVEAFPATRGKKIALFMARLHVKKGLEHLIRGWADLHEEFSEWQLVIAGPDRGFASAAQRLVQELAVDASVTFTGNLAGEQRLAALSAASLFVQPSFSEGFSMAVLEALACRLPVLLTPGCNFGAAIKADAGIEVAANSQATAAGLRQLLEMTDSARREMGQRGRKLVEEEYTWDRVAEQTLDVYHWLTGKRSAPATIVQ